MDSNIRLCVLVKTGTIEKIASTCECCRGRKKRKRKGRSTLQILGLIGGQLTQVPLRDDFKHDAKPLGTTPSSQRLRQWHVTLAFHFHQRLPCTQHFQRLQLQHGNGNPHRILCVVNCAWMARRSYHWRNWLRSFWLWNDRPQLVNSPKRRRRNQSWLGIDFRECKKKHNQFKRQKWYLNHNHLNSKTIISLLILWFRDIKLR